MQQVHIYHIEPQAKGKKKRKNRTYPFLDGNMEWLSSVSAFLSVPVGIYLLQEWRKRPERIREQMGKELKAYTGSCHCKSVRFTLLAPRHLVVWNCNCSICFMKKNWHFVIPESQFALVESSQDYLTEYRFNTKKARHLFCKVCGVQAYYVPRSNPDGIAVTLACIPAEQVESFDLRNFDGTNWESFFACSNISQFSSNSATNNDTSTTNVTMIKSRSNSTAMKGHDDSDSGKSDIANSASS